MLKSASNRFRHMLGCISLFAMKFFIDQQHLRHNVYANILYLQILQLLWHHNLQICLSNRVTHQHKETRRLFPLQQLSSLETKFKTLKLSPHMKIMNYWYFQFCNAFYSPGYTRKMCAVSLYITPILKP